jgi:hypothetical protein
MLSTKTVPLSVRVPYEDAEFIAGLHVNGANTPSDKLRAIINQARRRHQGGQDFGSALTFFEEQIAPVAHQIRKGERECHMHSELLGLANSKLPELLAFIVSYGADRESLDSEALQELESGVANRVFRLFEGVMRLAVTPRCPCYDENVISDRIDPLIDLARIILSSGNLREESL